MPHQIIGLAAISLTVAVLLRGWGVSHRTAFLLGGLGLAATALIALGDTGPRVEPGLTGPSETETMRPLQSVVVPQRPGGATAGVDAFFP
ncbi:hypothetical protein [Methylobacterium gregans]|uniref:Uncharacterized protein n=1 Tax=Methylobacterium gregans TaxID=374424 RepID=A0AA37HNA9_9HYPH|nr:hypothetical protein [Methylobacterium gregans]MDQ0520988.1 hypothetical protein [Methylobacterium gregans]GJD77917.1 hypothetical protein NBEOAGPD_1129 [Methylobacterium gregans]GLS54154.1 hypothetical protein GCM10007886_23370 [Methylobacterium gregans]